MKLILSLIFVILPISIAHHILGRPDYSLNEDSNTSPSMQVETRIGNYIITAMFEADGEPYTIDFPLQIGQQPAIGPLGITVAIIILILVMVSIIQRKKTPNCQNS